MSVSTHEDIRRISISLTGTASLTVQELAGRLSLSEGDVVRRAISVLNEIVAFEERGSKILIREPEASDPEVVRFIYS